MAVSRIPRAVVDVEPKLFADVVLTALRARGVHAVTADNRQGIPVDVAIVSGPRPSYTAPTVIELSGDLGDRCLVRQGGEAIRLVLREVSLLADLLIACCPQPELEQATAAIAH